MSDGSRKQDFLGVASQEVRTTHRDHCWGFRRLFLGLDGKDFSPLHSPFPFLQAQHSTAMHSTAPAHLLPFQKVTGRSGPCKSVNSDFQSPLESRLLHTDSEFNHWLCLGRRRGLGNGELTFQNLTLAASAQRFRVFSCLSRIFVTSLILQNLMTLDPELATS